MSEYVTVKLNTANNKPVREGFMVVGKGEVDGKETDIFFWDPPQADKLHPGVIVKVEFDGKNARWQTRDGKTSFHIRQYANLEFEDGGTPSTTQPARTQTQHTTPTQSGPTTNALSIGELNDVTLEIITDMYHKALDVGLPEAMCEQAGLDAAKYRPIYWFGEKV